ncbi:S1 RNA-binding domain-containing protein [uncultured Thiohalocapsa sp.]|uniref:30S ribosomal protein S1 n=1 Tax=uncultured Thiohalocapsa sp. TaxID=768990 RepID=UPI0025DE206C|nr:S1 RNA-binding domain-containing protein [uncultured Thiohalocapsa sp.]
MTDESEFEALLRELEKTEQAVAERPKPGERVKGQVLAIDEAQVFVDLGGKAEGVMDIGNLKNQDGSIKVAIGDELEAVVAGVDAETGAITLGGKHGKQAHGAEELEAAYQQGLPVEGSVTGTTKGGLEVRIAGHRAFCPASQADIRFVEDLSSMVGQQHAFRITKLEKGKRLNLVVSRRALLEAERAAQAEALKEQLQEGAVLNGTVVGIKEFGAFVDLGGAEGMVHISEMSLTRIRHPEDLLSLGQEVEVQVLRIENTGNPKRPQKIALSIRALAKDPWSDVAVRYAPGSRVDGRVTRTQPFGAFVELEPGLEGMIHISELGAGRRLNHPDEVLSTGQPVTATVLKVEPERKRIGLSLAADGGAPDDEPPPERSGRGGGRRGRRDDIADPDDRLGTFGDLLKKQMGRDD